LPYHKTITIASHQKQSHDMNRTTAQIAPTPIKRQKPEYHSGNETPSAQQQDAKKERASFAIQERRALV
jgi:hypothetical protein